MKRILASLWPESGGSRLVQRAGVGMVAASASGIVLSALLSVGLARTLGPDEYGDYAFAMSVVLILLLPSQLGMPISSLRTLAQYVAGQQWRLAKGLLIRSEVVVLSATTVVVGSVGVLVALSGLDWTLLWALPLLFVLGLEGLRGAELRGLGYVVRGHLPGATIRPGVLLVTVLLIAGSVGWDMDASQTLLLHAGAGAVALLVGTVWLLRRIPEPILREAPNYRTREWVVGALPFFGLGLIEVVNAQVDLIVLGVNASSADVGIYRVALATSALGAFFLSSANLLVQPRIARLHSRGQSDALQLLVTRFVRLTTLASIPLIAGLIMLGQPLVELVYGEEYSLAYVPLAILLLGQAFNVVAGPVANVLNMSGNEQETIRGLLLATGIAVAASLILVPSWGVVGAASAHATAQISWNVYLSVRVRTVLNLPVSVWHRHNR